MKLCSHCRDTKPTDQFYRTKSTADGLQRYCKQCQQEMSRQYYQVNKRTYNDRAVKARSSIRAWWITYREGLRCSKCPESRYWCLDFHHRDAASKDKNVSAMLYRSSKEKILKEVELCDVVCRNCHANIHWNPNNGGVGERLSRLSAKQELIEQ